MSKDNEQVSGNVPTRKVHLDLLRIISCFLVIVNHTNSSIFLERVPSKTWTASLLYFIICRIAVPIFIMISGYTLFNSDCSWRKTLKRILRIAIVLLLFSVFYYIYYFVDYKSGNKFHLGEFFALIFKKPATNAFWYLYHYLGLLLMTPLLQKLVTVMRKKDYLIYFSISIFSFSFWPIVVHFFPDASYSGNFELPFYTSCICFLLLGYYISTYCTYSRKKMLFSLILFIISVGSCFALIYSEYTSGVEEYYLFFSNYSLLPVLTASICVFYAAQFFKCTDTVAKLISQIGQYAFCIYLLSDYVLKKLYSIYSKGCLFLHPFLSMVIYEICVFCACLIISFFLRKIPYLKKWL